MRPGRPQSAAGENRSASARPPRPLGPCAAPVQAQVLILSAARSVRCFDSSQGNPMLVLLEYPVLGLGLCVDIDQCDLSPVCCCGSECVPALFRASNLLRSHLLPCVPFLCASLALTIAAAAMRTLPPQVLTPGEMLSQQEILVLDIGRRFSSNMFVAPPLPPPPLPTLPPPPPLAAVSAGEHPRPGTLN